MRQEEGRAQPLKESHIPRTWHKLIRTNLVQDGRLNFHLTLSLRVRSLWDTPGTMMTPRMTPKSKKVGGDPFSGNPTLFPKQLEYSPYSLAYVITHLYTLPIPYPGASLVFWDGSHSVCRMYFSQGHSYFLRQPHSLGRLMTIWMDLRRGGKNT